MKTLSLPTPRSAAEAAYQTRVQDRADGLFSDGYKLKSGAEMFPELKNGMADLYLVTSPAGEYYVVDGMLGTCTCKHFEANSYCKHYLAVAREVAVFTEFDAAVQLFAAGLPDGLNPLIPG